MSFYVFQIHGGVDDEKPSTNLPKIEHIVRFELENSKKTVSQTPLCVCVRGGKFEEDVVGELS